jgi:ribonucrease Y
MIMYPMLALVGGLLVGLAGGFLLRRKVAENQFRNLQAQGKQIIENAIVEAEQRKKEALLQSKEEAYQLKQLVEKELKADRSEIKDDKLQLHKKRELLKKEWEAFDAKRSSLEVAEERLQQKEAAVENNLKEAEQLVGKQRYELARVAGISQEDAKKMLMESLESEARLAAGKRLAQIENEMKMEADRKGKNILALAISRYAGDYVADKTVSMVPLPNDEMKGRIIGREGRNIRAIEAATGIDIIIDDTP